MFSKKFDSFNEILSLHTDLKLKELNKCKILCLSDTRNILFTTIIEQLLIKHSRKISVQYKVLSKDENMSFSRSLKFVVKKIQFDNSNKASVLNVIVHLNSEIFLY